MEIREHIVEYDIYCPNCKFKDKDENQDPCSTCLSMPTNENSRKPWYFEQREYTKKEKAEMKKKTKKQNKKG